MSKSNPETKVDNNNDGCNKGYDNDETILSGEEQKIIDEFLDFINHSVSPYHAVQATMNILNKNNFVKLNEKQNWSQLKPGNYYFTRDQSTIIIFVVPQNYKKGNGFTIMGAHTDSPCFRIKPKSKKKSEGYIQVGVEKYGGLLAHTWFDRDLSVAGRTLVENDDNTFESKLVKINRPILRISTLAIHLSRSVNTEGFKFDMETNTVPIFATEAAVQLNNKLNIKTESVIDKHHNSMLIRLLSKELKCKTKSINDFELYLFDTQKSRQGGALNEFIFSPRLDNLCSCFVILKSLINSIKNNDFKNETNIRIGAMFDNEEVGSDSNRGAGSNIMLSTLKRLSSSDTFQEAIANSILISCDMAHAVHPNYASKHESNHKPQMHKGITLKYNCNQRYATNMLSTFHLLQCSKKLNINVQKFVVKNSQRCGSTIGPILAKGCGIRTVDVGIPQLSMHSIREVCGVKDICSTIKLFTQYYSSFTKLDASFKAD